MKVSEHWLRTLVSPPLTSQALAEQLSMAGLEVDAIEPVAGEFSGVVVGKVVACEQHPDADKLRVTKVDVGADALLDIVCGAPNCRLGLVVAVATVGAVLPGDFKIKKAKLRGQPSEGMLCSFSELGISDDHDGIIELPADAPIGSCIREYLNLDDVSFDIDLTPNRADCLGVLGIAREVALLNDLPLPPVEIPVITPWSEARREVLVEAPKACPRYLGRLISGIDPKQPSPMWLQERLRRSGVRSIDAVVDVTNYVLLLLGHPLHAFDNDQLEGAIRVRFAHQHEGLTLLNEQDVVLDTDTLVIADDHKALAMAGIFGGLHSGVTGKTRDVFLESAYFDPDVIKGVGRRYGLSTDASHRYERGVDYRLQRDAIELATELLLTIVGGDAGPIVEALDQSNVPQPAAIRCSLSRLNQIAGHQFEVGRVTEILTRLGLEPSYDATSESWLVTAPSFRFDIAIEEDVIEEIIRVFGYQNIPYQPLTGRLQGTVSAEYQLTTQAVASMLRARGFSEVICYSFVDPKLQSLLHPDQPTLDLPHPISTEMSQMRLSTLTGLLTTAAYNHKRQSQHLRLFETGLVFQPNPEQPTGADQIVKIGGVMTGLQAEKTWNQAARAFDFFDIKGAVEAILALTNRAADFSFVAEEHPAFHPYQCATVSCASTGQKVGILGKCHPSHKKAFGLQADAFMFELDWSAITSVAPVAASMPAKFPMNRRDIAVLVDASIPVATLIGCIKSLDIPELIDLRVFDLYKGQDDSSNEHSVAMTLFIQSRDKTLDDQGIQSVVDRVVETLHQTYKAVLRE